MKKIVLSSPGVQQPKVHKGWRSFANSVEMQRLKILDERIERQKKFLAILLRIGRRSVPG
ncbi:hypothetical protein AN476_18775 [Phaeobacter sp. 11ANDIMAR09]|nr:hypothetical protein AN476_18775 [Phaeobacter sp. 11ANDIMAR09]